MTKNAREQRSRYRGWRMNVEKNERLIADWWAMWSAIQQAQAVNTCNESINSLAKIAKEAMIRCGQIEEEE